MKEREREIGTERGPHGSCEVSRLPDLPRGETKLKGISFLFLFLRYYFMWSIFKIFLEFVTILLLLYVLVF